MGSKRAVNLLRKAMRPLMVANMNQLTCHDITSNYIRFVTRDWDGLSLSTKTDANADSGFTMAADTVHQVAALGDASNAIVLPEASVGALTVFRWTAVADGGSNITFTTASGEFYAAQTLNIPVLNLANGFGPAPYVIGNSWTDTVAIGSGTIVTATAAHNTLTLTHTATNNQTNIGAEIAFFCSTENYWRVAFIGSELGNGAVNTNFAFSTA